MSLLFQLVDIHEIQYASFKLFKWRFSCNRYWVKTSLPFSVGHKPVLAINNRMNLRVCLIT